MSHTLSWHSHDEGCYIQHRGGFAFKLYSAMLFHFKCFLGECLRLRLGRSVTRTDASLPHSADASYVPVCTAWRHRAAGWSKKKKTRLSAWHDVWCVHLLWELKGLEKNKCFEVLITLHQLSFEAYEPQTQPLCSFCIPIDCSSQDLTHPP